MDGPSLLLTAGVDRTAKNEIIFRACAAVDRAASFRFATILRVSNIGPLDHARVTYILCLHMLNYRPCVFAIPSRGAIDGNDSDFPKGFVTAV
jgi:hypothetical protein